MTSARTRSSRPPDPVRADRQARSGAWSAPAPAGALSCVGCHNGVWPSCSLSDSTVHGRAPGVNPTMVANLARGAYSALGAGWHKGVQWGVGAPIAKLRRRQARRDGVDAAPTGIADILSAERAIRLPEPFEGRSLGRIGNLEVRLATRKSEIRRAQRLRFKVFYEEMSAVPTGLAALSRRDADGYDALCDHLLVLDHAAAEARRSPSSSRGRRSSGPTGCCAARWPSAMPASIPRPSTTSRRCSPPRGTGGCWNSAAPACSSPTGASAPSSCCGRGSTPTSCTTGSTR